MNNRRILIAVVFHFADPNFPDGQTYEHFQVEELYKKYSLQFNEGMFDAAFANDRCHF